MKPNLTILISLFFLSATNYLMAQPSTSFYFTTAIPVNEYQNFDNEVGYGGNFEFFFISPSKEKPIGMGVSLSYLGQGLYFYDDPCDCETNLGNNRANNFINLNMILQVAPTGGTVRPYLETIFGGSYIFSNTELITLNYNSVNLYIDDWAWTYGIGGGFKFLLGAQENESGSVYLDIKGRYLMSSAVYLLDRNSIRYANDRFYYSVNETQINFVAVQVGIVLYFR
ncbi:MAG: hypothetical protein OEM46_01430 [Ignavibacteria bacterium]|nr:hypothetical protein [Ignavibacteria bacterium]